MNSHQVGVAAESLTATMFAWVGYDVSVQYGANQPEYDLVVVKGDDLVKVSVKGSKDGGWGLTQKYKSTVVNYYEAAEKWGQKHGEKTIVSLVQFKGVDINSGTLPRVYITTPSEIVERLKTARNGVGDTIIKEYHQWTSGVAKGTIDKIPEEWRFTERRVEELISRVLK